MNKKLIELIRQEFRNQLFFIIVNEKDYTNSIKKKLKSIFSNEGIYSYFDEKNIIELDINKLSLSIIKIYMYFNQIDDYDLIDFANKNELLLSERQIDGLKEEIDEVTNNVHTINIKLCGNSSTGKSTFINKILEEKRALIEKSAGTTKKSNIFISKKYHLKFIDDLGFNEGKEGEVNQEIESLINEKHRIYIDENMKLSFGYNNDSRNNFHLLLYFFKYKNSYNIREAHLKFMNTIKDKEIPIIFVINDCDDEILKDKIKYDKKIEKRKNKENVNNKENEENEEDEEDEEDEGDEENEYTFETLLRDIEHQLQYKNNENYQKIIIPIHCLKRKGFDGLFEKIYDIFKDNLVSVEDLNKFKNGANYEGHKYNLEELTINNIFLKDIKKEDIISEQMKASVELIKSLNSKLTGQYSGTLTFKPYIRFLFNRAWNNMAKKIFFWRSSNEFYHLLTELVLTIYNIFGYEKNKEECNEYIRQILLNYFKTDGNDKISYEKFKNDIKNYRYLFHYTEKNFIYENDNNVNQVNYDNRQIEINYDKFTNTGKFFLEAEEKILNLKGIEIININNTIINDTINDTYLNINNDDTTEEEAKNLIQDEEIGKKDSNEKLESSIQSNNAYKAKFNDVFENNSNYLKKQFGINNGDNMVINNNDKILLKIFMIDLVCKNLTYKLSEKSHNMSDVFYNLAKQYNDSIEGLKQIKEYFHNINEEKNNNLNEIIKLIK